MSSAGAESLFFLTNVGWQPGDDHCAHYQKGINLLLCCIQIKYTETQELCYWNEAGHQGGTSGFSVGCFYS